MTQGRQSRFWQFFSSPHTLIGKLTRIYLALALIILTCVGLATQFFLYHHARGNALDSLKTRAVALANNLESAVSFHDASFAQKALNELRHFPDVVAAQVILSDGQLLAHFGERIDPAALVALQRGPRLDWQRLGVLQPIETGTETSAPVQLALIVSIQKLNEESLVLIASGIMFGLLILTLTYLLFLRLSKKISQPVETLAKVIQEIETSRNYAMRAPVLSDDEIGELAKRFNAMISALECQNTNLDQELTERTRMQEKLDHLAHYDAITHLPNRHFFHERLAIATEQSQLTGRSMAVIFVDLDNFKLVNDNYGHHVGDQLLKGVAERLAGALRNGDIVSRLGGDEFAIIIEGINQTDLLSMIAEKLIQSLVLPLTIENVDIVVSGSVGIAVSPEDADKTDTLLRFADMAMYAAKHEGKNTWRRYDVSMSGNSARRLTLESRLRTAIQAECFELHYQPQFNMNLRRVTGFEALIRWSDGENGNVSPTVFIPVAEESGLINPLGAWVLRTACRQAVVWQQAGLDKFRIAVNISVRQLQQPDFVSMVKAVLSETGCPAELIELEITESILMHYGGHSKSFLDQFREMSLDIAIDDFGTGYSSMAHLKHLPVTKLKIDKSFIDDIVFDPAALAIASTITALAKNLGMGLIAEGVEDAHQAQLLQHIGCDTIQGYHIAKPMSANDIPEFLKSMDAVLFTPVNQAPSNP